MFWKTAPTGPFSPNLSLKCPGPVVKFWVRKIPNLGHSLKIVFPGQFFLNSTITASRARFERVWLSKLAIFVKIGSKRLLQVLVQGSQNRDYRTSQNGPCGCLARLKFCLWTSVASKCWCVSFGLALILCRQNWGVRKSRFWQISLFGRKSSILRNAHLKLFRASKRAFNRFFELFRVDLPWNTCLGKICEILLSSIFEGPNPPKMVDLGKSMVAKIRQNCTVWAENFRWR